MLFSYLGALMVCLWLVCWRVRGRSAALARIQCSLQLSQLSVVWAYGFDPDEALRCSKSPVVRDTSAGGDLGPINVAGLTLTRMPGIVASVIQVLADLLVTLRFVAYGQ